MLLRECKDTGNKFWTLFVGPEKILLVILGMNGYSGNFSNMFFIAQKIF